MDRRPARRLLAGFGAIAFFRSSLFTLRVGGDDVGVGPSALLQSLLSAADRMIDRDQAQGRARGVTAAMLNIDFDRARAALPTLCFALFENITPEEQKAASDQIKSLTETADIRADEKAIILGVYLTRLVSADVLFLAVQALVLAVQALGDAIRRTSAGPTGATGATAATGPTGATGAPPHA